MRRVKVLSILLAAGALALGSGLVLAATSETKAPEGSKTPAVSKSSATSPEQESKETKAVQQTEKAQAAREGKEKEVAADRIVRGEVTAVEPGAKTLSVKVMRGKEAEDVGVQVPDNAKITQGKATKSLADIKIGDRVWMKYDRTGDKLVADLIHILPAHKMAATKKSS